ncbi:MAG TPA: hypothetical protein VFO01_08715 [Trebonia sp.]|nr:hypothetical protein [Trebonia sp.]
MAFSANRSRPFRSLGLYKSSGKHAAPKGWVPEPRPAADDQARPHRPAHAATMPRLTGPHADRDQDDD